jgi:tRNA pseudouridine65 synthase
MSSAQPLRLLYRDEHWVAIQKPAGMLMHRSALANRATSFVLQALRDQLGRRVYPVHRLDRATSGVLLFGLSGAAARCLGEACTAPSAVKLYHAVVRGWVSERGAIDHPVRDPDSGGNPRPALTRYRRLAHIELPYAVDRYPTSRYSLVEILPATGRRHQIRQHFKHIHHPLIGDTSYGKGRHNRFFREQFGIARLLLEARLLRFPNPWGPGICEIVSYPDKAWTKAENLFTEPQSARTRDLKPFSV